MRACVWEGGRGERHGPATRTFKVDPIRVGQAFPGADVEHQRRVACHTVVDVVVAKSGEEVQSWRESG